MLLIMPECACLAIDYVQKLYSTLLFHVTLKIFSLSKKTFDLDSKNLIFFDFFKKVFTIPRKNK